MPEQTSSGGKHMNGFCSHNSMKRISLLQAFRLGFGSILDNVIRFIPSSLT
jgi:hypothetical protein